MALSFRNFVCAALAFGIAIAPVGVSAQVSYDPGNNAPSPGSPNEGSKDEGFKRCPISHDTGCAPNRKLPRAKSKDECDCQVRKVVKGGKIIWIKDCYVQLPDNSIRYCLNPKS